jgi:hypothetical protein
MSEVPLQEEEEESEVEGGCGCVVQGLKRPQSTFFCLVFLSLAGSLALSVQSTLFFRLLSLATLSSLCLFFLLSLAFSLARLHAPPPTSHQK